MAVVNKLKTTIYLSPEAHEKLKAHILEKYKSDARLMSFVIEEAILEYLAAHESEE